MCKSCIALSLLFTFSNVAAQTFVRITQGVVASDNEKSRGISWGDFNNDGFLDLFVANTDHENNSLYTNTGDGTFSKVVTGDIVNDGDPAQSGSWGDYDNDGDLDLFVAFLDPDNHLYRNEGDGTFTRIVTGTIVNDGGGSRDAAWGDYDNDGYLDLFVINRSGENNFLYHNNGDGTFIRVTEGPVVNDGGESTGCAWADYDNDGDLDLFVSNGSDQNNFLYKNNGNNGFTKITEGPVVNDGSSAQGGSWGDYDNDGDLDLFVANFEGNNFLYRNDGDDLFTLISDGELANDGGTTISSSWGDFDNDGDLDLFVVNRELNSNHLYSNDGAGHFTKQASSLVGNDGGLPISTTWADYNNDGFLDLSVSNLDTVNFLYANSGNENNWIDIELIGTISNTSAIGAKVHVKATINGQVVWQMQEVSGRTGLKGQNSLNSEFGTGDAVLIDLVKIEWPSGQMQFLEGLEANQFVTVVEPGPEVQLFTRITEGAVVTDFENSLGASWLDSNNDGLLDLFVANTVEASNSLYVNTGDGEFSKIGSGDILNDTGPAQAATWGDYDNDGDLDAFVPVLGQDNQLYRNNNDGTFTEVAEGGIVNDGGGSRSAAWGDYDNDGYLDLYVANRSMENNFLYRNNGNGTFTRITAGPPVTDGKDASSAIWGDYDNDSDIDLFVTTGSFQENLLYRNNGDGSFFQLTNDPVVTGGERSNGASWGDYDSDGFLDLFVGNRDANNWIYRNNGDGSFTLVADGPVSSDGGDASGSSWGDFDNDGDLDLIVGNLSEEDNFLYSNNGGGTFSRITGGEIVGDGGTSAASAWGDFDSDGDLDLHIANFAGKNFLYENNGNDNSWINVGLVGTVSNSSAIGAKVRLKATIWGESKWQMQEISSQTGRGGQNSLDAEFGLGDAELIDAIKIEWPSGLTQILRNRPVNQFLTIVESESLGDSISVEIGNVLAFPGDTVLVPIHVQFPVGSQFSATELAISGFQQKLEFVRIVTDSSLLAADNWSIEFNETDSSLVVAAAGASDISGEGVLFWLEFAVPDTLLGSIEISPESALFNTGEVPTRLVAGGIDVIMPIAGDVDLNEQVQAFDASLVLKYIVGSISLSPMQLSNANVTSDSSVSGLDASLILQHVVGLIDALPVDTTENGFLATGDVFMSDLDVQPGQIVEVPILLGQSANVIAFEGELVFDVENLEFIDIIWSESLVDFSFAHRQVGDRIRFVGAGRQPVPEAEALVSVQYLVSESFGMEETVVSLRRFRLNENTVQEDVATATLSPKVTGIDDGGELLPSVYALHQNYPNPFNPITQIRFQLPISGHAELAVFNIIGEKVRTMIGDHLAAGHHQLVWDGKDDEGIEVPSGVYLYRLTSHESRHTKKMLLLR